MGIEIERKFTVKELPKDLEKYPFHTIEQAYLNVHPAIRVRREDEIYYMTYKGTEDISNGLGNIGKTEYNMPLDSISYEHLSHKADGNVIRKKRYLITLNEDAFDTDYLHKNPKLKEAIEKGDIKIELDVFKAPFEGRILAEVEFPDEDSAKAYKPADWFSYDVTGDARYSNAHMSAETIE